MDSGYGVFETMRWHNNAIVYLSEHLGRLKDSCKFIGLPFKFSPAQLEKMIRDNVKPKQLNDVYVRLAVYKDGKGSDISLIVREYIAPSREKYLRGFRACLSPLRQSEGSALARIKATSRIFYELAYRKAKEKNFDEAVILNNRGCLCEASRSNIFLIKEKEVFSPAPECGCLDGITRRAVFDLAGKNKIKISEGRFTLYNLSEADEAFLTNSLIGIMPLALIEKQKIGDGQAGRMTKFFMEKYNEL